MMQDDKNRYHHGDLRASLLATASTMLAEQGIEQLSLRKLAELVGVSRTAAYHHFDNKNDLLCAIAAQGFEQWRTIADEIFHDQHRTDHQKYRDFVFAYLNFATDNPALYDLMFGGSIWRENQSTQALRDVAFPGFQHQLTMTKHWQQLGILSQHEDALRLSQVLWGTLHGIARLLNDGIYRDNSSVEAMCECAINLFAAQVNKA